MNLYIILFTYKVLNTIMYASLSRVKCYAVRGNRNYIFSKISA